MDCKKKISRLVLDPWQGAPSSATPTGRNNSLSTFPFKDLISVACQESLFGVKWSLKLQIVRLKSVVKYYSLTKYDGFVFNILDLMTFKFYCFPLNFPKNII